MGIHPLWHRNNRLPKVQKQRPARMMIVAYPPEIVDKQALNRHPICKNGRRKPQPVVTLPGTYLETL